MNTERSVTFAGLTAAAGEKTEGTFVLGEEFQIPGCVICGRQPGKTVLITAGIHAGEYVGIEAAIELSKELDPEKIEGTVVIAKCVCMDSFSNRAGSIQREDDQNLNRVFPGKEDGTYTERLAWHVYRELIERADFYIDLHSGDDYEELIPYVYYPGKADPEVTDYSRQMACQMDVGYMVCSNVTGGGAYNYAAFRGIPSILIERGQMGSHTSEEIISMKRDIMRVLRFIRISTEMGDSLNHAPLEIEEVRYQMAWENGIWYPEKKAGDMVRQGEILGHVSDFEGNVLETSYADMDGVILYQTGSLQVTEKGPMIAYGQIKRAPEDLKKKIVHYWTKRSDSFLKQRRAELHDPISERWMTEIRKYIPARAHLKILDAGCGAGFFSILLAKMGHEVIGIDLTENMIASARQLAEEEGADCTFRVMDAQELDFADETFDFVISRNLTWTLPDPEKAYKDWLRVLKPNGKILNFDANYGAADDMSVAAVPENHAHKQLGDEMISAHEEIKSRLAISRYARPAWDVNVLGSIAEGELRLDLSVGKRIYIKKDEFYNPVPIFVLCFTKPGRKKVLTDEIENYWTNRAEGYSMVNQEELASTASDRWFKEINGQIREAFGNRDRKEIRILDIGTGPGFFSIILANAGYDVTAVDYTEAMLEQARINAAAEGAGDKIRFMQMDGQNLQFEEGSFDVIVTRNLTWNLERPDQAYASWMHVLKKGGLLLNYDANWYTYLTDEEQNERYQAERKQVEESGIRDFEKDPGVDEDAIERIANRVPLTRAARPAWDLEVVHALSPSAVDADTEVWERVWSEDEKKNYSTTPMFRIKVRK